VLTREPELGALPPGTPGSVRLLLRRCLDRDPRHRLRDIGDAHVAFEESGKTGESAETGPPARPAAPVLARALPWIVAAAGLGLGLLALVRTHAGPATASTTTSTPVTRFTLQPGPPGEIDGFPAVSPDGRTILFGLVPDSGVSRLWAFSLTSGESRVLAGTEYGTDPFWSPDGRFIGYFARGELRRLELATSLSRALASASDSRGGTWSESGDLVFTPNSATGLFRVPAAGGTPVPVTQLEAGRQESHRYPTALPGGKAIVYGALGSGPGAAGLFWRSLGDGRTRRLADAVSRTAYDPRGYLLWVRQGTLVGQRLDPGTGELAGEPFPIAERVGGDAQRYGKTWFSAASGVVATRTGSSLTTQLRWYDRAGARLADVTSPGSFAEHRLSPDGRQVVVQVRDADSSRGDTWIYDVDGKDRSRRLTFSGSASTDTPAWSGDGRWVVYSSRGEGGSAVARTLADGSGKEERLYVHPESSYVDDVSPREPLAVLEAYDQDSGEDLLLLPLEGERKARPFLHTPAAEGHATFSPDGRLIGYSSDETGLPQVYVIEVAASGNRWQLTTEGGDQVSWRADGKELYYVGLDRVLRAVPVRSMAPFAVGEPVPLFKLEIPALAISGFRNYYCPSLDGRRFLVNALVARESEPGLRMVLGWNPPAGENR
jgi:Tol biopolymer transport system component